MRPFFSIHLWIGLVLIPGCRHFLLEEVHFEGLFLLFFLLVAVENDGSCFLDSTSVYDSYVSYIWRHKINSPRLYMCIRMQAFTDSQIQRTCLSETAERRDGYEPHGPGVCVRVCIYIAAHSLPVMIQSSTCIAWAFKSFRDGLAYMCVHCRRSTVLWHAY